MWRVCLFLLISLSAWTQDAHPILAVGSPAPDFELPGVDGKTHKLGDYAASPILVVVAGKNENTTSEDSLTV